MWEKSAGRRLFAKLPLGGRDEERVARVIAASDSEYDLPLEREPMTVAEADASAALPTAVPASEPPADVVDVEPSAVEENGDQVEGQASFAELAETAQQRRQAREMGEA
jgi:hypothetical protein